MQYELVKIERITSQLVSGILYTATLIVKHDDHLVGTSRRRLEATVWDRLWLHQRRITIIKDELGNSFNFTKAT